MTRTQDVPATQILQGSFSEWLKNCRDWETDSEICIKMPKPWISQSNHNQKEVERYILLIFKPYYKRYSNQDNEGGHKDYSMEEKKDQNKILMYTVSWLSYQDNTMEKGEFFQKLALEQKNWSSILSSHYTQKLNQNESQIYI